MKKFLIGFLGLMFLSQINIFASDLLTKEKAPTEKVYIAIDQHVMLFDGNEIATHFYIEHFFFRKNESLLCFNYKLKKNDNRTTSNHINKRARDGLTFYYFPCKEDSYKT